MVRVLKKFFKRPPREAAIAYGAGIGILLVLFIVLYFTVGKTLTSFVSDTQSFNMWLKQYNSLSAAVFVIIRAVQTVVKIIPAEPLEIASGYAFGMWGGLALCSLGTFIGSLVIICVARLAGRGFVKAFVNEEELNRLTLINDKKSQRLFLIVFYLIPGTPKDMMTYAAPGLKISLTEFFVITTICRIPSIVTSTICGSQIQSENYLTAFIVFAATAAASAVCAAVYARYKKKKTGSQ